MRIEIVWLLSILGTVAGLYGISKGEEKQSGRPLITVSRVIDRLRTLDGLETLALGRMPYSAFLEATGQQGEDNPDVHVLCGDGVLIGYVRHCDAFEQIAVTLEETEGVLAVYFRESTLQKLLIHHVELSADDVRIESRGQLGQLLGVTRRLVSLYS